MDVWILCKKENNVLTAVGIDTTEQAAKDMAQDGDYIAIPAQFGKRYPNLVDENMLGAAPFSNLSLYTVVQQAKAQLQTINGRLDNLETRVSSLGG